MRHAEGSGGGLDPSGLRDHAGRLWFSAIGGIVVVDPASFRVNRVAPAVVVESATAGGRDSLLGDGASLQIHAGTASIAISYTAFSFLAPAKVRFRYRCDLRCLPSRLIAHRHRPRAELQPAHELQVDTLR